MQVSSLSHVFVEQMPTEFEPGVLYVSLPFRTSVHLCACGCGNETWVPIRPDRHHLTFDGDTITLWPSVGNWRFQCRSHYVVRQGRIEWVVDGKDKSRASWWNNKRALRDR